MAIENLGLIATWIFQQFDAIWVLYTGGSVLGFTIILWILDRLFHIFDVLKK